MSDHLKSNTVIDLENMQRVVLSVHGHQLEVKYQQKDVEQLNQHAYIQETHLIDDKPDVKGKIAELFDLLKDNLSRSDLEEICITCHLESLRNLPKSCSDRSLINEMVQEAERTKKIEKVLRISQKLFDRP